MDAAMRAFDLNAVYRSLLTVQAQILQLYSQTSAWAARVDWAHLRPVLCVDGGIIVLCALLLFQPSRTEAEDQRFWTDIALAGRWMASIAGLGMAVWMTVNAAHLA